MLKHRGRMGLNSLECPESAKGGGMPPAHGNSTNNRSPPCCPPKLTARRESCLPVWRSAMVISLWRASFGAPRWGIRVRAMRPTSNWRFTTNITPATHAGRGRLFAKHSTNSAVQTAPAQSAQVHIVRSTHDSNIEWVGWNEKACGRSWMFWTRDSAQESESNGRRTKTCVGDHRGHPRRTSSKNDRGSV